MKAIFNYLKYSIIYFGLTLLFSNSIHAKTDIDSALVYYSQSEYEKALEIYLSLIENNYVSPELFYNTANSYYKINDLPNAILWYQRALLLNPSDPDIQKNLEITNTKIADKVEALPEIFYKRWYNNILNTNSSDNWAYIALLFFILLLLLSAWFLFTRFASIKKISFVSGFIALIFFILSLSLSITQKNRIVNNKYAIVFESTLVKSAPNDDATNLFEINEGLKLEIIETLNDWAKIGLADGKQGWIRLKCIENI